MVYGMLSYLNMLFVVLLLKLLERTWKVRYILFLLGVYLRCIRISYYHVDIIHVLMFVLIT